MGLRVGKAPVLLLCMAVCAPRCSECAMGGRELKMNEFPYTVFLNGMNSGYQAVDATGRLCLGVLHGSITVITAPSCFVDPNPHSRQGGSIRTAKNMFTAAEMPLSYPIIELHYSEPHLKPGSTFTFAIVNLILPGIMVDPLIDPMDNQTMDNSTGIKVADWYMDPRGVMQLTEKGMMGVVPTPDKKVVAMKLISMKECRERWYEVSPSTGTYGDGSVITSNAICAVKATGPVTRLEYEPVPPGYLCNSDAGSPFIYEDYVVGLLVQAFCDKEDTAFAVFLTTLPSDDIERADASSTTPEHPTSGNSSSSSSSKDPPFPPVHPVTAPPGMSSKKEGEESEGISIHSNRNYASIASTSILLILRL